MVEHWAVEYWKRHGTIPLGHSDKVASYRSESGGETAQTVATNKTSVEARIK
jgi:hypothetical protein